MHYFFWDTLYLELLSKATHHTPLVDIYQLSCVMWSVMHQLCPDNSPMFLFSLPTLTQNSSDLSIMLHAEHIVHSLLTHSSLTFC